MFEKEMMLALIKEGIHINVDDFSGNVTMNIAGVHIKYCGACYGAFDIDFSPALAALLKKSLGVTLDDIQMADAELRYASLFTRRFEKKD